MIPSPDQRVSLAPGVDEDDPRCCIEIDLHFDDSAVGTLLRARERYESVFAAAGRPVRIGPFHDLAPASSNHLGGTVRMHRRPEFGVLDEWNRVHDVPNVVVCDSSCFTTGPEKNPTLTAMAIAARAARQLAIETA
jgi:choline dehydrogenase-like flavoprotein